MDDQKNYKMRIIKWWPLVFLIFSPTAIKFPCFSSNVIGLPFFLSLALALSQLSRSMETLKFSRRIESALLLSLFFLSLKVRVATRFTAETRGVKCKISPRIDP